MALRKPLVIVSGQIEQLQAGDTVSGLVSASQATLTNDESGAVVCGAPVYADAVDGYKKAKANAAGTSAVIGLQVDASVAAGASGVIQNDGVLALSTGQWDAVAGTTGGLAFGTQYYLDPATAGKITATAPTTTGQLVCPIGIALSTTELLINILGTILL